jgi:hypothetical protein
LRLADRRSGDRGERDGGQEGVFHLMILMCTGIGARVCPRAMAVR